MNRNEYRRALIMLRSLKTSVSGYVRLERRTLMGTLQFTVNGATDAGNLYAVLLYRNGGGFSAIRLDQLSPPRYGQTGLVWKFDPRNIENRTLEQYDLAAVIEIRSGVCELLLCGNLNGSVDADWGQIRNAACRLFSPVKISGAPIAPIDEKKPCKSTSPDDGIQTLPEYGEETPVYLETDSETESTPIQPREESGSSEISAHYEAEVDSPSGLILQPDTSSSENTEMNECDCSLYESDELDTPAEQPDYSDEEGLQPSDCLQSEPDELDAPAREANDLLKNGTKSSTFIRINPDEFDVPAQNANDSCGTDTKPSSLLRIEPDELDVPARETNGSCGTDMKSLSLIHTEPDELDTPAQNDAFLTEARAALSAAVKGSETAELQPDELDTPAQDDFLPEITAGEQLSLSDPTAVWPASIEPLRKLFFSSKQVTPFEMDGYVFIRAPLPDESGSGSCFIGLSCLNGSPDHVCYAIPAAYSPEPPVGLEGYTWLGDRSSGYWVICERIAE